MLVIILSLLVASAQDLKGLTRYKWIADKKKTLKGRCVEIDKSSEGEDFYRKVSKSYCRPRKESLATLWLQNPKGPGGKCYSVDRETRGKKFSAIASKDLCRPKSFENQLIEGKCYQYGTREDGQAFLASSPKKDCEPKNIEPTFILRSDGFSGNCVTYDPETKEKFRRPLNDCRPDETIYQSINVKGETNCYEVAKNGGAEAYINSTSLKKCQPSDTFLSWSQESEKSGLCVLRSNSDSEFVQVVSALKCASLYKTRHYFEVTNVTKGKCYLIDIETSGKNFQHTSSLEKCRPLNVRPLLVTYRDAKHCVEIDQENPESGYRKKVNKGRCESNSGEFYWVLNKANRTKGVCYQKYTLGNAKANLKNVRTENCRPVATLYKWIFKDPEDLLSGSCYEIAEEGEADVYINGVEKHHCLAKRPTRIQFFHPEKYKKGGCYKIGVDQGKIFYSSRVRYELCKKLLDSKK